MDNVQFTVYGPVALEALPPDFAALLPEVFDRARLVVSHECRPLCLSLLMSILVET